MYRVVRNDTDQCRRSRLQRPLKSVPRQIINLGLYSKQTQVVPTFLTRAMKVPFPFKTARKVHELTGHNAVKPSDIIQNEKDHRTVDPFDEEAMDCQLLSEKYLLTMLTLYDDRDRG